MSAAVDLAFREAVRYFAALPVGDRGAAFLPDGSIVLLESVDEGVSVQTADSEDEAVLWMLPTRGEA